MVLALLFYTCRNPTISGVIKLKMNLLVDHINLNYRKPLSNRYLSGQNQVMVDLYFETFYSKKTKYIFVYG